jgi:iron(III) transport system substrate-binding protein
MRKESRRRVRFVAAGLVSLALVAAACGDDEETPAAPDTTAVAETTAAPDTTAAAADTTAAPDTTAAAVDEYQVALDQLIADAEAEGKLTVYSSIGEASLNEMAAKFEELYDIDVEAFRIVDGEAIPRLETEFNTNTYGADVATMAALGWIETQAAAGNWLPATASPSVAGLGEYDAAQYVREDGPVETGAAVLTFAWNTNEFPDGFTGYEDFLNRPELAGGRLGIIDSVAGPAVVDFWAWVTENFGEDYIPALAELEPRLYPSALPIGEALSSGEIAATIYAAPVQLIPAKANGAPVEFAIDEAGAWGARYFSMITKTAQNPNAAALWIEFYLSPEGQKLAHSGAGTVLPGIEGSLITQDKVRKMDTEVMAAENVATFNAYFDSLFK